MATPRAPPAAVSRRPPPPPSLEQEPDEIVGEFRRGKEIGKGSFATVYLAQHRVCPLRPLVIAYIEQDPIIIPSRIASHRPSNTMLTSAVEEEVVCCRQGSPDVKAYQEAQREPRHRDQHLEEPPASPHRCNVQSCRKTCPLLSYHGVLSTLGSVSVYEEARHPDELA